MMTARIILKRKGTDTVTIYQGELVATAVNLLTQENIGALVVTDDAPRVVGILSERDVIHSLARSGGQTLGKRVCDLMTDQTLTCNPDDDVKTLMRIMTRQRVRHLPVMEDGVLRGIVSIGDLLKHRLEEMETEQHVLRERLLGQ